MLITNSWIISLEEVERRPTPRSSQLQGMCFECRVFHFSFRPPLLRNDVDGVMRRRRQAVQDQLCKQPSLRINIHECEGWSSKVLSEALFRFYFIWSATASDREKVVFFFLVIIRNTFYRELGGTLQVILMWLLFGYVLFVKRNTSVTHMEYMSMCACACTCLWAITGRQRGRV